MDMVDMDMVDGDMVDVDMVVMVVIMIIIFMGAQCSMITVVLAKMEKKCQLTTC